MTDLRPATRQALLKAASELLAAGGSVSLAEIARHAGVGRATLHRHFDGRDDLIQSLIDWSLESLDEAANAAAGGSRSYNEALWAIVEAIIPLGDRYHFLAHTALSDIDPTLVARVEEQTEEMVRLIEQVQAEGAFRPGLSARWIVTVIDALIYAAWEQVEAGELAPRDAGALVRDTLMNGFGVSE